MTEAGSAAPRPRPPWRDPILIGAALLWAGILLGLRGAHLWATLPELRCVPFDAVALPGEEVEIAALCELRRPSGEVERAAIEIDLRLREEAPGSHRVSSGADGIARRLIVAPESPGSTAILARGVEPHAISPAPAPAGLLVVLDPARPLAIADTEGVPLGGAEEAGDLAGSGAESFAAITARQALVAVAASRSLVLLHAGSPEVAVKLREETPWRLVHRVPVIAREPGGDASTYRERQLDDWRRKFGGSVAGSNPPGAPTAGILGIAASRDACRDLTSAGLETWAVGAAAIGDAACEGARPLADWTRVAGALIEERERTRP